MRYANHMMIVLSKLPALTPAFMSADAVIAAPPLATTTGEKA
jgi:hypothetical protein